MRAPVLGIDLGGGQLRLAEVCREGEGRFALRGWHVAEVPPAALLNGQVLPGPHLAAALKAALAHVRPGARRAVIGLGPQVAVVRRILLPRVPPPRLRALVEMQGSDWIPFWREGACFDLAVTDPAAGAREQEVLLVAVPLPLVRGLQASLRRAGLCLAGIDLDVIGLYRAAVATGAVAGEGAVALVDGTAAPARFGLVVGGFPAVIRHLQPGESTLAVELRRTIDVTLARLRGAPPLAACVAALPGDGPGLLQHELGEGLPGRLARGFTVVAPIPAGLPPAAAVAVGLALGPAAGPCRLRLLPRPTGARLRERRLLAALLAAALVGAASFVDTQRRAVRELQQRAARLEEPLAASRRALAGEPQVAAREARLQQNAALLDYMLQNVPWSEAYPRLLALLPPGVELDAAGGELPQVTLRGTAESPAALAALVDALAGSDLFQDPEVQQYRPGQAGAPGAFAMRVTLRSRKVSL